METILILRQKLIGIYKLNEDKINILAKFIAGIAVFSLHEFAVIR